MTLETLDLDGSIPSRPHQLRESQRIIAIGFVQLKGEGRVGMAGMQTDDREAGVTQRVPVPHRERPRFHRDRGRLWRPLPQGPANGVWRRAAGPGPSGLSGFVNDTYRRFRL